MLNKFKPYFSLWLLAVISICPSCQGFVQGSLLVADKWRAFSQTTILAAPGSATDEDEERRKLLDMASKLREEAGALEATLRTEREASKSSDSSSRIEPTIPAIKYDKIGDSTWTLTYRFADEPAKEEEETENEKPVTFYRGKLSLRFKADGYTDLLSHEGVDAANTGIQVVKVWGWDEELSQEDSKRYVLFSMDATTPTNPSKQRFYFQARLEQDEKDGISLKEGTVTIKQDLAQSRGIMNMGFFSAQGILAQFRYVGDFIAKPTSSGS